MNEGFTVIDEVTIGSELSNIPVVEALIDKVCSQIGVSEDCYGNVLIAVTEAVNNAISHGNAFDPSAVVDVKVLDGSDAFGFSIKDSGSGFDYANLPDPTSPENIDKENGRGVFLMRNLADNIEFNESGNVVSVYFTK